MSSYSFTAFAESDLVGGGNISNGASFTMPSNATVTMTVSDDDAYLSGDSWKNENSNDSSGQTASITSASGEEGNGGQIYAEQYHWVYDQYGNWYVLIEIEQEDASGDYFAFYTGGNYSVPPAGAELTVGNSYNICSNWLKFDDMDSGDVTAPAPVVEPEVFSIEIAANDDAITVGEDETAGDDDGNVLSNDTLNGEAYEGDVKALVGGNGDQLGQWITGSNGGKIKLNANGEFDFDAAGHFDHLKTGQSAETTFTYQIAADGSAVPTHNVLFVFDVSNSTVGTDGQNEFVGAGVGDVNGDGVANTVLDAQIAAAKALIDNLKAQGIDPSNVNVGIVTFSGVASGYTNVDSANLGMFSLDDANLIETLEAIQSGGWTNYEAGLGEAEDWFNANADASDENVMYFLSDGRPVVGHNGYDYIEQDMSQFMDEVGRIESGFGASVHAIGVGENASMDILNAIDNSSDGAAQVSNVAELTAEVLNAHEFVEVADTATLTVTVEGKTDYDALDDVITVSESEASGDVDGNVLANDLEETDAYSGDVLAVNGETNKVGKVVHGDNGGKLVINADGTVDFDAAGDFDALNAGDTEQTTFTYEIEGGEMATVTFNVEGEDDPVVPTINIAIALQSSATMYAQGDTHNYVPDWADHNGDGIANQQIDMAYLMVADFMPEAFAAATEAGYNLNISLVSFREEGVDYRNVTKDNWQGQLNAKINSDNSADYGGAFESAERFFDDVAGADDTNLMFFIGNGQQTHSWHGERASLKSAHDVEIDAYLTDLEVNILDPNLVNMVAIDDGIIVDQSYADEVSDAQGWGMAQNMLSIDEYLI